LRTTYLEHFFVLLYYEINVLLTTWVLFTERTFEQQTVSDDIDDILSILQPKIKKTQNGVELLFTIKNTPSKKFHPQAVSDRYPVPKKQLLQIFDHAKHNYFFTFNYIRTLERVYGISENDICHIHGVSQGTEDLNNFESEDLVFGHGKKAYDTNVTNIVNTAYNITKKPVNQCILKNQSFFEKLEDITDIYSYGFSFGDVDMDAHCWLLLPPVSARRESLAGTGKKPPDPLNCSVKWQSANFDISQICMVCSMGKIKHCYKRR